MTQGQWYLSPSKSFSLRAMLLSKSLLAGFVTLLTCWYFISPYLVTPSPKFPLHMWAFLIIFISFKLNSRHCIIVTNCGCCFSLFCMNKLNLSLYHFISGTNWLRRRNINGQAQKIKISWKIGRNGGCIYCKTREKQLWCSQICKYLFQTW